tara:strand:- start:3077 stop:3817 length:741 start_codon:yes stop_codon:yes gene_type:complete
MSGLKRIFSHTDSGPILNINEDDCVVDLKNNLFGVIDGHGGSGVGDKGTNLIKSTMVDNYGTLVSDPDATMPFFFDPSSSLEVNALMNTFLLANDEMLKLNDGKNISNQAGASLIAGISVENSFHCVSVGHCLGVKVSEEDLSPFFLPDSSFNFSMMKHDENGQVFPYSFLGQSNEFNYNVKTMNLLEGETVFLMTDGVFQRVSGIELLSFFQTCDGNVSQLCDMVFALANDRGNKDNQSIVILEY